MVLRHSSGRSGIALTVIDASVFVDALVVDGPAGEAARSALRHELVLQVPAIFSAEVTSALRSLVLSGGIGEGRANAVLADVRAVRTIEYPFEPFAERAWSLRTNLSVYDAWYVALAEALGTTLVTTDQRLVDAPGSHCPVVHVEDLAR